MVNNHRDCPEYKIGSEVILESYVTAVRRLLYKKPASLPNSIVISTNLFGQPANFVSNDFCAKKELQFGKYKFLSSFIHPQNISENPKVFEMIIKFFYFLF